MGRELTDADIFMGYALGPIFSRIRRNCNAIQAVSAGVRHFLYPELRETRRDRNQCLLGSLHARRATYPWHGGDHTGPPVFPIACATSSRARGLPAIYGWTRRPRELRGQVLLSIGFGAIGRETARRLVRPLDMRIWAVTHSGRADADLADRAFGIEQLHQALPQADFVVIAAPDTPKPAI